LPRDARTVTIPSAQCVTAPHRAGPNDVVAGRRYRLSFAESARSNATDMDASSHSHPRLPVPPPPPPPPPPPAVPPPGSVDARVARSLSPTRGHVVALGCPLVTRCRPIDDVSRLITDANRRESTTRRDVVARSRSFEKSWTINNHVHSATFSATFRLTLRPACDRVYKPVAARSHAILSGTSGADIRSDVRPTLRYVRSRIGTTYTWLRTWS